MRIGRILGAAALLAPGLAAAQPAAQQPTVMGTTTERTAIVESVNMTERSVLLRGDSGAQSGALATVRVSPEVRNLAQIKPGDRVVATATDAIAVSMARPDVRGSTGSAVVAGRTAEGQRPGAGVAGADRVRVRIEGIDLGRNSVAFVGPNGQRREVRVTDPDMRRFMRTLRPGDEVDVFLIESFSLRVLPPG
jgi:hypothetical protein